MKTWSSDGAPLGTHQCKKAPTTILQLTERWSLLSTTTVWLWNNNKCHPEFEIEALPRGICDMVRLTSRSDDLKHTVVMADYNGTMGAFLITIEEPEPEANPHQHLTPKVIVWTKRFREWGEVHTEAIRMCLYESSDGPDMIASTSADGTVQLLNFNDDNNRCIGTITLKESIEGHRLIFLRRGRILLLTDDELILLDVERASEPRTMCQSM